MGTFYLTHRYWILTQYQEGKNGIQTSLETINIDCQFVKVPVIVISLFPALTQIKLAALHTEIRWHGLTIASSCGKPCCIITLQPGQLGTHFLQELEFHVSVKFFLF